MYVYMCMYIYITQHFSDIAAVSSAKTPSEVMRNLTKGIFREVRGRPGSFINI